jgi:hypothetical protein
MMAQRANGDLRKQAVGSLGEQEMGGERQEHLEQKISSDAAFIRSPAITSAISIWAHHAARTIRDHG